MAAEVSVGLVLVGLGALNVPVDMVCHVGFFLIITGFFMLDRDLENDTTLI